MCISSSSEEIDLTYEGIATAIFDLYIANHMIFEEIDLTYEGIATMRLSLFHAQTTNSEEIDLTYEGIATACHCFMLRQQIGRN